MSLTLTELKDIEFAGIRPQQGGRLEYYTDTILKWEPYLYGAIGLYTGTTWVSVIPSATNVYFTTASAAMNGVALTSSKNYDVYARYQNATAFELGLYPWDSDTARTVTPSLFEGVYVHENTTTSGKQWRYLGTVRLNASTYFADVENQRFIVNWNNKKLKHVRTYNTYGAALTIPATVNAWFELNAATQVKGEFLSLSSDLSLAGAVMMGGAGMYENYINFTYHCCMSLNSVTAQATYSFRGSKYEPNQSAWVQGLSLHAPVMIAPVFGYNYISLLYYKTYNNTQTAWVDSNSHTGFIYLWV
jgi:hypothetical protein